MRLAIFNSFPFHYEVFGYIIHFAKQNGYHIDIYTNFNNQLGWFDFYQKKFNNITFINFIKYQNNGYEYVFVTTDDDRYFKNEWITDNVICINHYYKIRNPNYKKFINLANFLDSKLDYSLACYPIVDVSEKKQNNVVTIIGGENIERIDIIERLRSSDGKPVILNILGRNIIKPIIKGKFIVNCIQNIDTPQMFEILKESSYILLNFRINKDFNIGKKSSGSLPIALSCLCKPILSCNKIHKIEHAIEYNESFIKPIFLDNVNFDLLSKQRLQFIQKFDNLIKMNTINKIKVDSLQVIPKNIFQTWETKKLSPEFQKIVDTWIINNPEYSYQLYSGNDRELFIKENFNKDVFDCYCKIIPGAYKADLWRYCILYKYGGVYIDIDTICIGKLLDFIDINSTLIVPIDLNTNPNEGTHNLFNTFIASVPESSIMLDCISRIVYQVQNNIIPSSKLDFSGPGVLGRSVNKYLGLSETSSFIGKEGTINNITFLKFEKITEYIKDSFGNILFQNKNGNKDIQNIYNQECQKNKIISWVSCKNPLK